MKKIYTTGAMRRFFTAAFFAILALQLNSQVPQGFNYQAIARDGSGNPITGATIKVKLSILSDTLGFKATGAGVYVWEEEHLNVKTNAFGLFNVILGLGTKSAGSAATFSAVNWSSGPLYIGTKVSYPSTYRIMGSARLWTVPYAMVAGSVNGNISTPKLNVNGVTSNLEEALFEVKNQGGQTVFAVYNEGVRVYVDNGLAKGAKGGFAVGSFGTAKAPSQNLMTVSNDSVRIYVNETAAKGSKGGFAVGGFNTAKGTMYEFMFMTPENYFVGHNSGTLVSTGKYNSTLGYESGKNLTTAWNNVFVGYKSGFSTTNGGSNVFMGNSAGYLNTIGNYNIFLGRSAGYNNTEGWGNIFLGDYSGYQTNTGDQNVIIGDLAGFNNTTGSTNVFLGASSGNANTTGSYNNFIGYQAGYNNSTGLYNTYIGYQSGYSGASAAGNNNIALGYQSGFSQSAGEDNIAIGNLAGRSNTDGSYNVFMGSSAGRLNVTGNYNTMVGYKAGESNTANWNTMLGYLAGNASSTGGSQVLVGYQAGQNNTGGYNTIVGSVAGTSSGTGSFNTYLGLAAGEQATGSNNLFLGRWAGRFEGTNSNRLVVETSYDGTDYFNNALLYGHFTDKYLRVNGRLQQATNRDFDWAASFVNNGGTWGRYGLKVQAGASDAAGTNYMIDFYNGAGGWEGAIELINGTLSLVNTSDKNLKKDISPSGINALKILKDIEVVDYSYTKSPGAKHTGYIAQQVETVLPSMVRYNERDKLYAISQSDLIPVLHKAIVDQQKQIDAQAKKIEELEALIKSVMNK